mmetsp:Transcript_46923/g.124135  ORF Transcript_46923/g.124135 Transcript_46923/m.124135 type:complete len:317 (+) Transcript_46923:128-1078(+)
MDSNTQAAAVGEWSGRSAAAQLLNYIQWFWSGRGARRDWWIARGWCRGSQISCCCCAGTSGGVISELGAAIGFAECPSPVARPFGAGPGSSARGAGAVTDGLVMLPRGSGRWSAGGAAVPLRWSDALLANGVPHPAVYTMTRGRGSDLPRTGVREGRRRLVRGRPLVLRVCWPSVRGRHVHTPGAVAGTGRHLAWLASCWSASVDLHLEAPRGVVLRALVREQRLPRGACQGFLYRPEHAHWPCDIVYGCSRSRRRYTYSFSVKIALMRRRGAARELDARVSNDRAAVGAPGAARLAAVCSRDPPSWFSSQAAQGS